MRKGPRTTIHSKNIKTKSGIDQLTVIIIEDIIIILPMCDRGTGAIIDHIIDIPLIDIYRYHSCSLSLPSAAWATDKGEQKDSRNYIDRQFRERLVLIDCVIIHWSIFICRTVYHFLIRKWIWKWTVRFWQLIRTSWWFIYDDSLKKHNACSW